VLLAGVALCTPQVAGALPRHAAAAPAKKAATACKAKWTITGSTATVTATNCSSGDFLASYTATTNHFPPPNSSPQKLFDNRALEGSSGSVTVKLPTTCFWQVDFVTAGVVLPIIDSDHTYGARLLADRHGGTPCPTTTTIATTTTTMATTTTVAQQTSSSVLGTSIVPGTTATTAAVLASTQTLPRTGASHVGLEALLGLGLIALGGSMLAGDKRRRRLV
jgi:LPXTG-motif cell wall-anchored protein